MACFRNAAINLLWLAPQKTLPLLSEEMFTALIVCSPIWAL